MGLFSMKSWVKYFGLSDGYACLHYMCKHKNNIYFTVALDKQTSDIFFHVLLRSAYSRLSLVPLSNQFSLVVFLYYFYKENSLQSLLSLRSTLTSFNASKFTSLKLTYMATEDLSLDHWVPSCVRLVSTIKIVLKVTRRPSESDSTLKWTFHVWTTLSVLRWDPLLRATHCFALPIPCHFSAVCQYKGKNVAFVHRSCRWNAVE